MAFDSLPHDMLLRKRRACDLSDKACALVGSYLAYRWQQVRLGAHCSEWSEISKGVPQGCSTYVLMIYFLFQINLISITMLMIPVTVCRRLSRVFICLYGSVGSFRVRVFVVVV